MHIHFTFSLGSLSCAHTHTFLVLYFPTRCCSDYIQGIMELEESVQHYVMGAIQEVGSFVFVTLHFNFENRSSSVCTDHPYLYCLFAVICAS